MHHARHLLIGTIAAAALLALTACGGGSSSSTATSAVAPTPVASSGSSTADGGAQPFAAYRDCMAQNGVDLPDRGNRPSGMPSGVPSGMPTSMPSGGFPGGGFPGGLPDGVDQATFDAAQAACASLAPQLGQGGPGGGAAIDATALAAFTSCLSDHDVTVASGTEALQGLDRTDPTVKAALDVCAPLLPAPVPSS